MLGLIYRGLLLFFKNKQAVVGSLIGALIMVLLYVFLLGENLVEQLEMLENPQLLVDTWMLAGVIGISSASATLGSVSLMIRDKERQVYTDFMISPLSKPGITLGYFFSTYLISLIITIVMIILSEIYIVFVSQGSLLSITDFFLLLLASSLSILCSSAMMFCVASFFRRIDTFSTMTGIIGPLVGFLTGCYIPIGGLPELAQQVIKYFPLTSGIVLIRQIMTKQVFVTEKPEVVTEIKNQLGITLNLSHEVLIPILILVLTSCLFLSIAAWNVKQTEMTR